MDEGESAIRSKRQRRRRRTDWQAIRLQMLVLAIVAMVVAAGLIALQRWN